MLTPEDDIIIKQESSCPKEEAVAKLLGWMRGVRRNKKVQVTIDGIPEDQLEHLPSLDGTVQDRLSDLRTAAYIAYCEAALDFEPNEVVEEKRHDVDRLDGLITQAASYLQAIDRELQSDSPTIKVDQQATGSTGVLHLDLNSLDLWSHRKYQFSIFDPPSLPPIAEDAARKQSAQASSTDPWRIVDERDPVAAQPWYTPARYFARELVRERPALLLSRESLAKEVVTVAKKFGVPGSEVNPAAGLKQFQVEGRERFLTKEETQRLPDAVEQSENTQLKYIVALLLMLGCRKRELLDAKWEHFDLERRNWRIPLSKSGKSRHVPLSSAVVATLAQLPRWTDCPYVLPNPMTRKPFTGIHVAWDTARKRAGLPDVRMHDLRHTFASNLVNAGHSLFVVSKALGHANTLMTERYSHIANETLFAAADAAANAIGPSWTEAKQVPA